MIPGDELQRLLAGLPHGRQFRFVTDLTMLEPMVRATGTWIVSGEEHFFAGHFPGDPIVPGVLIAESLAQLCGLVVFKDETPVEFRKPHALLAQVDVKIHAAVRPPAQIDLSATLLREIGSLLLFEVAAKVCGTAAADGRIVLAKSP